MAEVAPVVVIDKVVADYRVHPLNMHATKVRDGMGERVTLQVLDRFLYNSPRSAELAPRASAMMAQHYADWGNKYFGARMNADALRCYRAALRLDRGQFGSGGFMHRYVGLLVGRKTYDSVKRVARRLAAPRLGTWESSEFCRRQRFCTFPTHSSPTPAAAQKFMSVDWRNVLRRADICRLSRRRTYNQANM
jgi:hypothetical protein